MCATHFIMKSNLNKIEASFKELRQFKVSSELDKDLEIQAKEDAIEDASEQIDQLRHEFERVHQALKAG